MSKPIDWLVKIVLSKNFLLGKTTATRRVYIQIDNLNDATIYLEMEQSNSLSGTVLCFLVDAILYYVSLIGIKQVGKVGS